MNHGLHCSAQAMLPCLLGLLLLLEALLASMAPAESSHKMTGRAASGAPLLTVPKADCTYGRLHIRATCPLTDSHIV